MRLVLEKEEILEVIAKHFKIKIDPDRVVIRTDPLEVELSGLPLVEDSTPSKRSSKVMSDPPAIVSSEDAVAPEEEEKLIALRSDRSATAEPPPPGADYLESTSSEKGGGLHPAAVLEVSKQLEAELNKENPSLALQQKKYASRSEVAPTDFTEEV